MTYDTVKYNFSLSLHFIYFVLIYILYSFVLLISLSLSLCISHHTHAYIASWARFYRRMKKKLFACVCVYVDCHYIIRVIDFYTVCLFFFLVLLHINKYFREKETKQEHFVYNFDMLFVFPISYLLFFLITLNW